MKRLLLALVLVVATAAIFLGPPLRAAFAATNVDIVIGRAELHPTAQALAFMLKAPEDENLTAKKKMKLWATYYHMPTVRPSWTSVAAKPLIDRKGRCRGALGMTVPMPAYKSGEHMVESVLPLLQETAQQLRPVL